MKYFGLISFFFILNTSSFQAQNLDLDWVRSFAAIESNASVLAHHLTIDSAGNNYVIGTFRGNADFDPGVGTSFLSTGLSDFSIFILKLDANGVFVWAKMVSGTSGTSLHPSGINADSFGNVYAYGSVNGTIDCDPGPANFNLTSSGYDLFVLKLDLDGTFLWAKQFAIGVDQYTNLSLDNDDKLYLFGKFSSVVDFDPNAGIYNLVSNGLTDNFILKLDENGTFMWVKRIGGTGVDSSGGSAIYDNRYIFLTGEYTGTVDFNPDTGVNNLTSSTSSDLFVSKLDLSGNFIWAKQMATSNTARSQSLSISETGEIYVSGYFAGSMDANTDSNFDITSAGSFDIFTVKLDSLGNYKWAKSIGGSHYENFGQSSLDAHGNIYITGAFEYTADFDPGASVYNLVSDGSKDIFISKLDSAGNFNYAYSFTQTGYDLGLSVGVDKDEKIVLIGTFSDPVDFDFGADSSLLNPVPPQDNLFIAKYTQKGITGKIFNDLNQNCVLNNLEAGLGGRMVLIQPGNIIAQTNSSGIWLIDSLAPGNYTVTIDSIGDWVSSCLSTQNFFVLNQDSITMAPTFGIYDTSPCSAPNVSIQMPAVRRCFSNQRIFVESCNVIDATSMLESAYTDIKLDENLVFQNSAIAAVNIGNNVYRFNHGDIYPGQCVGFTLDVQVSCQANLGQTLCVEANLYPADSCVFDTIREVNPADFNPCNLPWDHSSLSIDAICQNDSIYFTVVNNGSDMNCYSPVRLFIDGQYMWLDSVQLLAGENRIFSFSGDGRTWRLEVDQHPLHSGNSHPNASIEACGNSANWTSNLINILPHDDADAIKDIYCGVVTGSYDPNDKTGYPLGVGSSHLIQPNGQLNYVIRFQNTGTDTAFSVVVRDTLDTDLNIFSMQSAVSSHNYSFRMYGPRVLEWTFNNILLPDSTTNELASHGFVTFNVNQNPNLADSTEIKNNVGIYFDFNDPVITNTTLHKIGRGIYNPQNRIEKTIYLEGCEEVIYNSMKYTQSGVYYQLREGGINPDTLMILNADIKHTFSNIQEITCGSYTAPDMQVYNQSGIYTAVIPNSQGCDSTITIHLSVNSASSSITESVCQSYTAPDNQVYMQSGTYTAIISNTQGCDSTITVNLTVKNPSSSLLTESTCQSYTAPDNQVYTQSGIYTAIIPNYYGCDSTITIDLTIKNPTNSSITESVCQSYTAPDFEVYTQSGTYTAILANSQGCDSTITINLTVNNPSSSLISESTCQSYTAPDNQIYTQSGTYTALIPNASGCDSTITIDLTIKNPSSSSLEETVCQSYTAPDNQVYTQSGTYTAIIPNTQGCDSTITIDLMIKNPTSSSLTESVCSSYTAPDNQVYTQSGIYTAIIPNASGCDSTITIDLTVNTIISEITIDNTTLASTLNNAEYQWLDCLNNFDEINGETNQTFTPLVNGEYAVLVNANSCSDTSACVLVSTIGLNDFSQGSGFIHPNPASNYLNISFGEIKQAVSIKIYALSGQLMEEKEITDKENTEIDISTYANGMYLLELNFENKKEVLKFVKE